MNGHCMGKSWFYIYVNKLTKKSEIYIRSKRDAEPLVFLHAIKFLFRYTWLSIRAFKYIILANSLEVHKWCVLCTVILGVKRTQYAIYETNYNIFLNKFMNLISLTVSGVATRRGYVPPPCAPPPHMKFRKTLICTDTVR